MTKKLKERRKRLMPKGVPRWIRIYDNEGRSFDRYTVVFTGRYRHRIPGDEFFYRGMSKNPGPTHPQGFGVSGTSPFQIDTNTSGWPPKVGQSNHLGKRITFEDLPEECQRVVVDDYEAIWLLKDKAP